MPTSMESTTDNEPERFTDDEEAALLLVMQRLTQELRPLVTGGRKINPRQFDRHAEHSTRRVLEWLRRAEIEKPTLADMKRCMEEELNE